jgi:hypothetical protein
MKKILEFERSTKTLNTLYQRGHEFYLGGNGRTPTLITVKQAIGWFMDRRRYAQAFTYEGGIDFLLSYALQN